MSLPIAEWQASLDAIERALEAASAELDGHCRTCPSCATDATDDPGETNTLHRLEGRLDEWDARLGAATALVGSIQAELEDREAELHEWRERFARWRGLIEQN